MHSLIRKNRVTADELSRAIAEIDNTLSQLEKRMQAVKTDLDKIRSTARRIEVQRLESLLMVMAGQRGELDDDRAALAERLKKISGDVGNESIRSIT